MPSEEPIHAGTYSSRKNAESYKKTLEKSGQKPVIQIRFYHDVMLFPWQTPESVIAAYKKQIKKHERAIEGIWAEIRKLEDQATLEEWKHGTKGR